MSTIPAHLVMRLEAIFAGVPGVDVVQLAILLLELTGKDGLPIPSERHEIPAKCGHAKWQLGHKGIVSLEAVAMFTESQFLKMGQFCPPDVQQIEQAMAEVGLGWRKC